MTRGFSRHHQRMGTQAASEARQRNAALEALTPQSEAELRRHICDALRQMGWHAVDTSQDTPARGGLRGLPDLIAFKLGRTLLIETKHGRNDLSDAQVKFGAAIAQHTDPRTLIYCTARSVDDVLAALGLQ